MANAENKTTKKVTKKKEVKKAPVAVVETTAVVAEVTPVETAPAVETKKKPNKEKKAVAIQVMDNDTLKKLFQDNGCKTCTNADNGSKVVYNTFGTKSRILQQGKAYQLLLTNGHKKSKDEIVACDNDDTARFIEWYGTLTDEQKGWVTGFSEITATKLSASEMPRERTVKITSYDLLVEFIKHMATFEENKIVSSIAG